MAELPGNSQKPLAFGTICPAAFLLSLIRKEWGWMQSTSSPSDVTRLCKLGLLYSFSSSSPPFPSAVCSSPCSLFICFFYSFQHLSFSVSSLSVVFSLEVLYVNMYVYSKSNTTINSVHKTRAGTSRV